MAKIEWSSIAALQHGLVALPFDLVIAEYVNILLHEYDALRAEALSKMDAINRTLSWGILLVTGVGTVGFSNWGTGDAVHALAFLPFNVFLPLLGMTFYLVAETYLVEVLRIGDFILVREQQLARSPEFVGLHSDQLLGPLAWETWVNMYIPSTSYATGRPLGYEGIGPVIATAFSAFPGFVYLAAKNGVYLIYDLLAVGVAAVIYMWIVRKYVGWKRGTPGPDSDPQSSVIHPGASGP